MGSSSINREANFGLAGSRRPTFLDRLGRVLSEAKTSGNLATWAAILLSFAITFGTVLVKAGQIIDRQDALADKITAQDRLQLERDANQANRIADLEKRLAKAEMDNDKLKDRITSTRELVIASGGKLIPRDDKEK